MVCPLDTRGGPLGEGGGPAAREMQEPEARMPTEAPGGPSEVKQGVSTQRLREKRRVWGADSGGERGSPLPQGVGPPLQGAGALRVGKETRGRCGTYSHLGEGCGSGRAEARRQGQHQGGALPHTQREDSRARHPPCTPQGVPRRRLNCKGMSVAGHRRSTSSKGRSKACTTALPCSLSLTHSLRAVSPSAGAVPDTQALEL